MQAAGIPSIEGLYASYTAIMDAALDDSDQVLVVGAGGGREIEALTVSNRRLNLTGIDPSADMLDLASEVARASGFPADRLTLTKGTVDTLDQTPAFDAASSILVMHFLPDDGQKLAFLRSIRERLKPGAPFVLVDVMINDTAEFEQLKPVFVEHARRHGMPDDALKTAPDMIASLPAISEGRTRDLLEEAAFGQVTPFFRSLWYVGVTATAA